METEKSIVKTAETRLPKFVEDAYDSIEKMEKFANILLESKLVPNHFYEQLPDKKPDFTKGKVPAVVAVLIQGYQLQLPPLTALQHIIPVNGLLSIKGDLAKSMIFNSGKLKPGSWVEEETGSIEAGDYTVKITATRSDNGQTLSRSFSVGQAKRAGLWITEQQVNGQDGWKYKSSAWWKYPSRMCNYRALGFIARDMFPDVMAGIYTTEEAMDIPKDTVEVIETESGSKITIPDKEHSKARSTKMTDRVADKIPDNKFDKVAATDTQYTEVVDEPPVKTNEQPPKEESSFIPTRNSVEYLDGKEIIREANPPSTQEVATNGKLTLEVMEKMEASVLLKIVNDDMDMMEGAELIGGKNTNKKLRGIIFAQQNGTLAEYVAKELPKPENQPKELLQGEIPPNKLFSEQGAQPSVDNFLDNTPKKEAGNKYNLEVPAYDKGDSRDFASQKLLYNKMVGLEPQITSPRYLVLGEKLGFLARYPDKEIFVKLASISEINDLLNSN